MALDKMAQWAKVTVAKPDSLSPVPQTHRVEGENQFPHITLWFVPTHSDFSHPWPSFCGNPWQDSQWYEVETCSFLSSPRLGSPRLPHAKCDRGASESCRALRRERGKLTMHYWHFWLLGLYTTPKPGPGWMRDDDISDAKVLCGHRHHPFPPEAVLPIQTPLANSHSVLLTLHGADIAHEFLVMDEPAAVRGKWESGSQSP